MKLITIGFSIHRPEIIGITADLMQRHDVIFLEEPPVNGLQGMGKRITRNASGRTVN
jgi:hypothetical protein